MGRRNHRNDVAGEHPFSDTGQLIFLFIFLAVWIVDSFIFRYSTFISKYISIFVRIPLIILILCAAGYLAKKGMDVVHGKAETESGVFKNGVFGLVRHPVYLGSILFYLGLLASTLSIFAAIIWIAIVIFYHYISKYEEKLLLNKYGKDYEAYKQSVPMWIPRIKRK
jgi:protein-S-isoprenylcysteine O-methyltransferase Ste14